MLQDVGRSLIGDTLAAHPWQHRGEYQVFYSAVASGTPTLNAFTGTFSYHTSAGPANFHEAINLVNNNIGTSNRPVLVLLRFTRDNVDSYAADLLAFQARGGKVITMDYIATRQAAIATGSASMPYDKNAFAFQRYPLYADASLVLPIIRGDVGRDCVVSGRTNIQTFDGLIYQHDDIGDFVLMKQFPVTGFSCPISFEFQIRKSQCEDSTSRKACITGVAARYTNGCSSTEYDDVVINYDRETNGAIFQYKGDIIPIDTVESQTSDLISVQRIEPDVGMRVIFKSSSYIPVLTVQFYVDESIDPVIVVHGTYSTFLYTTGMCGTHDSCDLNDFITPDGTFTVENATFTTEWRVHGAASIFEWYQYRTESTASFTLRQPLYQPGWTSQMKKHDLGEPELSDEAIYLMCEDACNYGTSGSAWINQMGVTEICQDYCDEVSSDMTDLLHFDIHSNFTAAPPQVHVATLQNGKVSARIPVEGTYVFGVQSHDCCTTSEPANVTLEVKCESKFEANAGEDLSVPLASFIHQLIRLEGSIKSEPKNIHFSWKALEWPGKDDLDEAPEIVYPFSLRPYFKTNGAGNYSFELAAFDGCRLSKDTVNVTVECAETHFVRVVSRSQSVWRSSTSGNPAVFTQPRVQYTDRCPSITTSKVSVPVNLTFITPKDTAFTIKYNPNFTRQWEVGIWSEQTTWTTNSTTELHPPSEVSTSWAQVPPQNGLVRTEATYRTVTITNQSSTETITNFTFTNVVNLPQCSIRLTQTESWPTSTSTWSFEPSKLSTLAPVIPLWASPDHVRVASQMRFGHGFCQGRYNTTTVLQVRNGCQDQTDNYDLDVICGADWTGPLAKPLVPCQPVLFDYVNLNFPTVDPTTDSSDRWNRGRTDRWELVSHPNTTSYNWFPNTPRLISLIEAQYTLEHTSSNGCKWDSELVDISFECTGDVTANIQCEKTTLIYNYSAPQSDNVFQVKLNPKSTAKLPSGEFAPAINLDWQVKLADGTISAFPGSVNFTYDVKFHNTRSVPSSIISTVTDHCRTVTNICPLTLSCPNQITSSITVVNSSNIWVRPSISLSGISFASTVVLHDNSSHTDHPIIKRPLKFTNSNESITVDVATPTLNVHSQPLDFAPGRYFVRQSVSDGCQWVDGQLKSFDLHCVPNVIRPVLVLVSGKTTLHVENNTAVSVSTANSTFTPYDAYTWSALATLTVESPQGIIFTSTDFITQAQPLSLTYTWTPDLVGQYFVRLNITDGCNSASTTMSIEVLCLNTISAAISQTTEVTWEGDKFPVVSVDGKPSVWTFAKPTYLWEVLSAPLGSLFQGRYNYVIEELVDETYVLSETNNGNLYFPEKLTTNTTTRKTSHQIQYNVTRIANQESSQIFGSCFRPDLPGDYILELQLLYPVCQMVKTTTMTVKARCNGAPSVHATVPQEGAPYDQLLLDASGTTDPESDSLSFQWTVYNCTSLLQYSNVLLNSQSAQAVFTPTNVQEFCVSLVVSDGCTPITKNYVINVACRADMPQIEDQTVKVKFNGLDLQEVDMEIPLDDSVNASWYNTHTYEWTLLSYDPTSIKVSKFTDGEIAGIVIGVIAGVALIVALVLLAIFVVVPAISGAGKAGVEMAAAAS